MSKKYNEIMDKVVVTDEMRERLLAGIADADPDRLSERYKAIEDAVSAGAFSVRRSRRPQTAKILAYLAAACAVITIMGIAASITQIKSSDTASVAMSEYAATEGTADMYEAADMEEAAKDTADAGGAAAAGGTAAETVVGTEAAENTVTTETASEDAVMLSGEEIREVVEAYIGESNTITDVSEDGSVIVYTIAASASGRAHTYIRIDVRSGEVEIEDVRTQKSEKIHFSDMKNH